MKKNNHSEKESQDKEKMETEQEEIKTRDNNKEKDVDLNKTLTVNEKEFNDLKEKAAKADEYWDRILRITAEFENTKKRLEKRNQEFVKFANEQIILETLHVSDDLDRGIESLDKDYDAALVKKGFEAVRDKLRKILDSNGVKSIDSAGKLFDPNLHEAVGEVETDDVEEGIIYDELQPGYTLNGRLARPSRVRVAKKKKL
jgi:molecular chaperone GrpE